MFLIDFLFALPLWLLAVVLTAFFGSFALGGLWVVRRYVLPRLDLRYEDAYYAAVMVQSVMLLYGLVAALTAVSVWQRYSEVSGVVSNEATAIASLWRDIGGYPQPLRDQARDTLRDYTLQIVEEAWPLQQQGKIPTEGVAWMDKLQAQMFTFVPANAGQQAIHAEALRAFNQLVQQRRQRLDAVQGGLPPVLWAVLFPGAMVCIFLCLFFHVKRAYLHAFLLLGVSASIAMVLFVIVALDRPFVGDAAITADSYRLIHDHHMKR